MVGGGGGGGGVSGLHGGDMVWYGMVVVLVPLQTKKRGRKNKKCTNSQSPTDAKSSLHMVVG
jgi:hypothetical protein